MDEVKREDKFFLKDENPIELFKAICEYVTANRVDVDIHIYESGDISVSVAPTYRDVPQTDCSWK